MSAAVSEAQRGFSAILGGSFDPIHLGHLHVASQILQSPEIERLIFMPVRHHHFKTGSIIAGFETRLRLIRSCLQDGMEAWDTDGSGSGYSADLMRKLQNLYPEMDFLFVIGADNLPTLTAWYDFEWLRYNVQ
ncbi:MAG: nicotinate-nicotinamide nucleotide adenylyltransferase, partial [Candidatus Cloacimonadaceae bacterium]|nr:nicotinate-nicotinamide nucleotide adenylyltransferase [Candidatus Cloacimonadaceae bacterium]